MIAEAIERIRELAIDADVIETLEHKGQTFTKDTLRRIPDEKPVPTVDALKVSTLRSLAAYLTENPDKVDEGSFVTVLSPTHVEVVTPVIGEDAKRKTFAVATARLPTVRIGAWLSTEDLAVHLRTCFVETAVRDQVVAFLGGIADKAEVQTKDDGISQSTTVRSGISMLKEGNVPSPVELQPYRTFYDVEQPESPFILRLKKGGEGVLAGLFEADGGAWQHEATEAVAKYLRDAVSLKVFA